MCTSCVKLPAAAWWLCVASLAACPACVQPTVFQLDNARPFLTVNSIQVQWGSGAAAQWVLSSLLVRVHPRGLFFKPQRWRMRDLSRLGWSAEDCVASAFGLCQTRTSVLFSSTQPPVINQYRGGECSSANTGRLITNASRYDASACDVLDAAMDFVYASNAMWRARTELPEWIYWTVCVLVVYLVRCLSKYILASMGNTERARRAAATGTGAARGTKNGTAKGGAEPDADLPDPLLCLMACLVCLVLILSQGDGCFVTVEDALFYWFTVSYILTYACLFLGTMFLRKLGRFSGKDPPFYNLLAGVLQLVAARLYAGAETPYNPPIIFVVAVRALVKCRRGVDFVRCATLALDACMLGLTCALGFSPDPRYLLALFTGAMAWVDFLV